MFSFNNPLGACPRCEGYGKVIGIDEDLVDPRQDQDHLSRTPSPAGAARRCAMVEGAAGAERLRSSTSPIHPAVPRADAASRNGICCGTRQRAYFHGLDDFFAYLDSRTPQDTVPRHASRATPARPPAPTASGSTPPQGGALRAGRAARPSPTWWCHAGRRARIAFFAGLQLDERARRRRPRRESSTEIRNRLQYLATTWGSAT